MIIVDRDYHCRIPRIFEKMFGTFVSSSELTCAANSSFNSRAVFASANETCKFRNCIFKRSIQAYCMQRSTATLKILCASMFWKNHITKNNIYLFYETKIPISSLPQQAKITYSWPVSETLFNAGKETFFCWQKVYIRITAQKYWKSFHSHLLANCNLQVEQTGR
ncbi:hypothetical protein T02_3146 [Trichinella nativa]|uniref:Uncharacterized protein n=1 Tax=Trichinella nativa TaxID=6335 RepID=A0A0V1LMC8_9BILA|nr:hypothetical protein T02_3146 [Trichinella nativa]